MINNPFEVFRVMNEDDIKNNTGNVVLSTHVLSAEKVKAGGKVAIGVDHAGINKVMSELAGNNDTMIVLLLVNRKEYLKIKGE